MGLVFSKHRPHRAHCLERTNIMKRVQSNIVNIGFTILNQPSEDSKGRKLKTQGLELNQAVVNGNSAGVTLRTINGGQKSAAINMDQETVRDLLTALNEVLESGNS